MENKNKNLKPTYIKKDNFRFVLPYDYCYQTFVKSRWDKHEILEVLQKEFSLFTPQYYEDAIKNGKILINGQQTTKEYKLQMNDKLEHFIVRHEPPVYDKTIEIVFEDDELLVVNKPSSMPVHEGGAYYFNSLTKILQFENGYEQIYSMHRIDRLTSGIVLFSKQSETVQKFHEAQNSKQIEKIYLAKVSGDFSKVKGLTNNEIMIETFIYCQSFKEGKYAVLSGDSEIEIKNKHAKMYILYLKQYCKGYYQNQIFGL